VAAGPAEMPTGCPECSRDCEEARAAMIAAAKDALVSALAELGPALLKASLAATEKDNADTAGKCHAASTDAPQRLDIGQPTTSEGSLVGSEESSYSSYDGGWIAPPTPFDEEDSVYSMSSVPTLCPGVVSGAAARGLLEQFGFGFRAARPPSQEASGGLDLEQGGARASGTMSGVLPSGLPEPPVLDPNRVWQTGAGASRLEPVASPRQVAPLESAAALSGQGAVPKHATPVVLRFLGVTPWSAASWAYRLLLRVVVVVAAVLPFVLRLTVDATLQVEVRAHIAEGSHGAQLLFLIPMPAVALALLLAFARSKHRVRVTNSSMLLQAMMQHHRSSPWLARRARADAAMLSLLWLFTQAAQAVMCPPASEDGVLRAISVAVCSGVILGFASAVAGVCRWLSLVIDVYCCGVVFRMRPQEAVREWKSTHAALRMASDAVSPALVCLCAGLALVLPLPLVDIAATGHANQALDLLPMLFVLVGVLHTLFLAAEVSEMCARVPALVNAHTFGWGMEDSRQRAVEYIRSSDAGIRILDARLSLLTVTKVAYACCLTVATTARFCATSAA